MARGVFITFEGCDGVGKSTQIALLAQTLVKYGHKVLELREPGGSAVSEMIRAILLDAQNGEITPKTELLLYEAARAQIVDEIVIPALQDGYVVLCDRFYDSTTAYQGFGRDLDLSMISTLNAIAAGEAIPDRTIYLDVDSDTLAKRATIRGEVPDRLESEGHTFQERVREGFLHVGAEEPDRVRVVDGSGAKEETAQLVLEAVSDLGLFGQETL